MFGLIQNKEEGWVLLKKTPSHWEVVPGRKEATHAGLVKKSKGFGGTEKEHLVDSTIVTKGEFFSETGNRQMLTNNTITKHPFIL